MLYLAQKCLNRMLDIQWTSSIWWMCSRMHMLWSNSSRSVLSFEMSWILFCSVECLFPFKMLNIPVAHSVLAYVHGERWSSWMICSIWSKISKMNTKWFLGSVAGTKETLYTQNDIQFSGGGGCRKTRTVLTHCGRVTQICVFTLQLCRTGDANLRF